MQKIFDHPKIVLVSRLLLIGYTAAVAWAIYTYVIVPSGQFHWDEAGHATRGLIVAEDLDQESWLALLYDVYRQVYWSPIHPLVLGLAFWVGGSTTVIARSVSLLFFTASAVLIYLAGWRLKVEKNYIAAFIAAFLFLSAPALVPFAGQAMLETVALFFLILAILVFFVRNEQSSGFVSAALGVCIVGAYFSKTNYGILLMIVVGFELLIEAQFRPRKLFNRSLLYLVLPIVIAFVIWFAYPPKIVQTWTTLTNQPFGTAETFSLEGLLFYPREFVNISGGTLMFVLLFASSVSAVYITRFREKRIRFLALLVLVQLLIGQLHQTKVSRHLFPILPALFLCTSFFLTSGVKGPSLMKRLKPAWLISAALVVTSTYLFIRSLSPISSLWNRDVIDYIAKVVSEDSSILILGTNNLNDPTPTLLDWMLIAEEGLMPATHSDEVMNYDHDKKIAALVERAPVPDFLAARLQDIAKRGEKSTKVRTFYLGFSDASYSRDSAGLAEHLQDMYEKDQFDSVFVLTPKNIARSAVGIGQTPFTLDFIRPSMERLKLELSDTVVFERVNTRIDVYQAR